MKHKPTAISILRILDAQEMLNPNVKILLENGDAFKWIGFGEDKYFTACKALRIKPNKKLIRAYNLKDRT
jgi:hypothetical protein